MKDFAGNELSVGSEIAFIEPGYRNLLKGTVYAVTEKRVKVRYNPAYKGGKSETIIDPTLTAIKIGGQ
jgi:FKBP-type peptidyl-prolyl cis-trans isomerase 2